MTSAMFDFAPLLPAGLPIGLVVSKGRERKVVLYADPLAAEEVRILNFRSPAEEMPKPSDQDLPVPTDARCRQFMFDKHRNEIDGGPAHPTEEDVKGERANG